MATEREHQTSLALEDAELQKTALKSEADNQVKELQVELETARTVSLLNKEKYHFIQFVFICLTRSGKCSHTDEAVHLLQHMC